jgi:hypothetical protein
MSQFEFLSVLVSIVLGLGLAHLSEGVFRMVYRRRVSDITFVLAGFTFIVLVLNWWTFFAWASRTEWTFEEFLLLVLWALSFYGLAVALFPPDKSRATGDPDQHRWFAGALLITISLDIAQMALRGSLFAPWYYLPFVGQYAICCVGLIWADSRLVQRAISWWLFLSITLWSLVVRRYLVG